MGKRKLSYKPKKRVPPQNRKKRRDANGEVKNGLCPISQPADFNLGTPINQPTDSSLVTPINQPTDTNLVTPISQPTDSSPVSSVVQAHHEIAETASSTAQKAAPSSAGRKRCRTSGKARHGKEKCKVDEPQTSGVKVKGVKNIASTSISEEVAAQDGTEVGDGSDPTYHAIETRDPGIAGSCIQMAIYLLKTMDEFESIEIEVRYLPKKQEPVLHMRRRDLYGVMGWPGDPVTTTLTTQGLLTHRVVYCAPRNVQLTHQNKLMVDKFITQIRWLTSITSLCLGVPKYTTLTAPPLPGLVLFYSPELRVQSKSCPLVLHGRQRRCPGCEQHPNVLPPQHDETLDPHSSSNSNDADISLPVYFETEENPSQGKKRKLSKTNPSILRKQKQSKPNSSSNFSPTAIGEMRNMHSDNIAEPSMNFPTCVVRNVHNDDIEPGSMNLSSSIVRNLHRDNTESSDIGSMNLSSNVPTAVRELHNSITVKVEPDYDSTYIENGNRTEVDMLVGDTGSSFVGCEQHSLNMSSSFAFNPASAAHDNVADTVTQDSIATTAIQDNGAATAFHDNLNTTVAQDSKAAVAIPDSIESSTVLINLNGVVVKHDPDDDDDRGLETDSHTFTKTNDAFLGMKHNNVLQDSNLHDLHTNCVSHSHRSTTDSHSVLTPSVTDSVCHLVKQEPVESSAVAHTLDNTSEYSMCDYHVFTTNPETLCPENVSMSCGSGDNGGGDGNANKTCDAMSEQDEETEERSVHQASELRIQEVTSNGIVVKLENTDFYAN